MHGDKLETGRSSRNVSLGTCVWMLQLTEGKRDTRAKGICSREKYERRGWNMHGGYRMNSLIEGGEGEGVNQGWWWM